MRAANPASAQGTKPRSRTDTGAAPGAFERGFRAGTEAQRAVAADAIRCALLVADRYAAADPALAKCLERLREVLP